MELDDRINAIVKYSGLSVRALAIKIGAKTSQTLYELLKGKTKTLSNSVQSGILNAFPEISRSWLLTGEGDMLKDDNAQFYEDATSASDDNGDITRVPIIHIDSVGGIHSENAILSPEYIEGYLPIAGARRGDVAIYQSGTSMAPAIPSGAILLIREVEGWREYIGYGDVFVLLLNDDRRITKEIRRYIPDPQNYYWCVSYNPDVADEELPKHMVRRVWKVIKVLIDKGW